MKLDPLFVTSLLLYFKHGTTFKCHINHTATQYRLCLEIGEHGLLEGRIVTCPRNQPCNDPEFYPCWIGKTTSVEISTRDGVTTVSTKSSTSLEGTTQAPEVPNRFGFSLLVNSSSQNGSEFFFNREPEIVTENVTSVSSTWTATEDSEENDVTTNTEPNRSSESVTTVLDSAIEVADVETLSTSVAESTISVKSAENEPNKSTKTITTVMDLVSEDGDVKTTSLLAEGSTAGPEPFGSTESVTTFMDLVSENGDPKISLTLVEGITTIPENTETEPYRSTQSVTAVTDLALSKNNAITTTSESPKTTNTKPITQTTALTKTTTTSTFTTISGANIILSTISTILGIILGFILIDFIFW